MTSNELSSKRRTRSDAGMIRLTDRDAAGLCLLAEQYAAPYDLLAASLGVPPARCRAIIGRWRTAGLVRTGVLSAGPVWCWPAKAGMTATGYGWHVRPPALSMLAHIRAVFAARMWLASGPVWERNRAWWRCERDIRAAEHPGVGAGHVADAEIWWPSVQGSPYSGQAWAVEVELTPKPIARTSAVISCLLGGPYAQVLYLAAPAARPVIARAASRFTAQQAARLSVLDLPAAARMPKATR